MGRLNPQALARLRGTLQQHIDDRRIPGAIAVVAIGGQVEQFEVLGALDPAAGTAMREDAVFRIYSMTKPLVSLAALMLAEEGRLQLVDPVARFLPAFGAQQVAVEQGGAVRLEPVRRQATVHDLLRHTAGLTYEFLGDSAVQRGYTAVDIATVAAATWRSARCWQPSRWPTSRAAAGITAAPPTCSARCWRWPPASRWARCCASASWIHWG